MTVSLDEFCDFPRLFDTFKSQKLHEFYGQDETHIIYESVKLQKFTVKNQLIFLAKNVNCCKDKRNQE